MAMLQDVNRHELVAGINGLNEADRRDLFDRCVALLSSDRRLTRREIRFLAQIRRSCGIGFWSFRRLVWKATWRRRVVIAGLFVGSALSEPARILTRFDLSHVDRRPVVHHASQSIR